MKLNKGDKVAIISLSRGLLGEGFMKHQRKLIEKRLQSFGLEVVYTPNALKGIEFLKDNPKKRAQDLKWAFKDESIKGIICAIGGDDTYRTLPYLLEDDEFKELVKTNPKLFIGYSDTTINHLMFQKLGLPTFYGHSAIVDFGELDDEMLPYSKKWFEKLFNIEENIEIESSAIWYLEREDFSQTQIGISRIVKKETHGIEILSGEGNVSGELFGGCVESLGELLLGDRYGDEAKMNERYQLFPTRKELKGKIIFLENSDEQPTPQRLRQLLEVLDEHGLFEQASGVIIGKPQDETYYDEYKLLYKEIIGKYEMPVFYNLNFGHAHPKCILPYGASAELDVMNKKVVIKDWLKEK
ncbi:MAG: LD-carboxypeptidase [Streptococcaceae bacterium]|jgi:muramoyltetrapeptide carboxypeptidase LdcA involved in peptidoglycan recycling|nr:LD-carboxypeptidase [Streptococcaceae bacterium]